MKNFFKNLVLVMLLFYLASAALPYFWPYLYDGDVLAALSWNGWGALVSPTGVIPWLVFAAYIVLSIGLILFRKWARTGFLILTIGSGLLGPVWGLYVTTGIDSVLGYFMVLGDGALLVIAYLTKVSNEFA